MSSSPRRTRGPDPPSRRLFSAALARNLVLALLVATAMGYGAFAPLDRFLSDQRFACATGSVSGQVVTVEIDSQSLSELGVWPWPRALHGALVDRLVAMGARRIVFDVDFSAESAPENDRVFAAALRRAAGKVWLAAFQQGGGANGRATVNSPIPLFAEQAHSVSIDVPLAPDGFVRDYFTSLDVGGWELPTAGALLADRTEGGPFGIDYGLDLRQLARLSAADVLANRVPRILVDGRDIIIGASAEELRDAFLTPRYGLLPGLAVHALAAETLLTGRELRRTPWEAVAALIFALALAAGALEPRLNGFAAGASLALAGLGVEAGALGLHKWAALTTPTAGPQIALATFALAGLVSALGRRRKMLFEAARERDETRAMLSQVISDNFDGVVVIGDDGQILTASQPAREIVGRALGGVAVVALPFALGQAVALALDPAFSNRGPKVGETQLPGPDGTMRHLEFVVTTSRVPSAPDRRVVCLTFRDVTERRAHLARLAFLARHDEVTGAWTRGELIETLRHHIADGRPGLTVYCVTLRRFDLVNDVFGHDTGDRLLAAVVERLRGLGFSLIARLGGTSFAFATPGAAASDELLTRGAELADKIARPYLFGEQPLIVGASLGATTSQISGDDPATLLTHASMAQASASRRVGDVFALFSPEMETRRREKQALDANLRRAVADGSLSLNFQPKVDLRSRRLIGAEALMRWRNADGDSVPPSIFVPVAEESGLIVELGRIALRRACAEAARWPEDCVVAVNVSPVQFGLSDICADVQTALLAAGLPAHRLEIEITESVFVDGNSSICVALDRLRAMGVKIALDDFGTGYSSLCYLGRLPIDTIKIDQSFVRALRCCEPSAAATVAAIVALAKAHDKYLVAEGIETADDAVRLAAMGCEYGQGYHFGRAQDPAIFRAGLREAREREAA